MKEFKDFLFDCQKTFYCNEIITFYTRTGEKYKIILSGKNFEAIPQLQNDSKVVVSGEEQIMEFLEQLEEDGEI